MSTNSTPDRTSLEAAAAAEQAAEQAYKMATHSAAIAAAKARLRDAWRSLLFRPDNTAELADDDLVLLNEAAAELLAQGLDPNNAADLLTNNWQPDGNTVESLIEPYTLAAALRRSGARV